MQGNRKSTYTVLKIVAFCLIDLLHIALLIMAYVPLDGLLRVASFILAYSLTNLIDIA